MIHSMTKAEVEKAGALLIDTLKEEKFFIHPFCLGYERKNENFLLQVIESRTAMPIFTILL